MPIIAGPLSARIWRVRDSLPPHFTDLFQQGLKRNAFRPIDTGKGQLRSMGWVNIRQILDSKMTVDKVLFRDVIAVALRVDRITINARVFRATLSEKIGAALREEKRKKLTSEERGVIEEQVRMELANAQAPSTSIHEMAWHLESGVVFFGATSEHLNIAFADLFGQTFTLALEPQLPYLRAESWARKQGRESELAGLRPGAFSADAPSEVIHPVSAQ